MVALEAERETELLPGTTVPAVPVLDVSSAVVFEDAGKGGWLPDDSTEDGIKVVDWDVTLPETDKDTEVLPTVPTVPVLDS